MTLPSTQDLTGTWTNGYVGRGDVYWDDWQAPHRDVLMASLRAVEPFREVLEVGCNAGPNLRRIVALWPSTDLTGVDVNLRALEYGQERAKQEGWSWHPVLGGMEILPHLAPRDVVLTCYTLCYVSPQDIMPVLTQLTRLARKALILAEPMTLEGPEAIHVGGIPEYRYNYQARLGGGEITPVDPPHQGLNGVLILRT